MKEILNNPDIYGNITKNQIQKSLMFRRQVENQKQALHSGKPAGLNKYHKMSGKIMAAGTGLGALIGGIAGASK